MSAARVHDRSRTLMAAAAARSDALIPSSATRLLRTPVIVSTIPWGNTRSGFDATIMSSTSALLRLVAGR